MNPTKNTRNSTTIALSVFALCISCLAFITSMNASTPNRGGFTQPIPGTTANTGYGFVEEEQDMSMEEPKMEAFISCRVLGTGGTEYVLRINTRASDYWILKLNYENGDQIHPETALTEGVEIEMRYESFDQQAFGTLNVLAEPVQDCGLMPAGG